MNTLPEDIFRELLNYLSDGDQLQLLDCATFYKDIKKAVRKVQLTENRLELCKRNPKFLAMVQALMEDPGRQLIIRGEERSTSERFPCNVIKIFSATNPFPFKKIHLLRDVRFSFLYRLFPICPEIKIDTVEIYHHYHSNIDQSRMDCLVQMCDLGLIKNLSIENGSPERFSIPYFPKIESLIVNPGYEVFDDIALPASYVTHLQELVLIKCHNIDVSCLDHIPKLGLISCRILRGLSCLKNNREIRLLDCNINSDPDLTQSFINAEEITLVLGNRDSGIRLDLSQWRKVKMLKVRLYHHCKPFFLSKRLPPTVRKCILEADATESIDWRPFTRQLTELSLINSSSIYSIKDLGLDHIPIVTLDTLSNLKSLEGLGGRNRKVTVRKCFYAENFSVLKSVDTVTIDSCHPGFKDFKDVEEVRVLETDCSGKLVNMKCLRKKTEVLEIPGTVIRSPIYPVLCKIPHLILYCPKVKELKALLSFKEEKNENQTITVYYEKDFRNKNAPPPMKRYHQNHFSSDFHYSEYLRRGDIGMFKLIRNDDEHKPTPKPKAKAKAKPKVTKNAHKADDSTN